MNIIKQTSGVTLFYCILLTVSYYSIVTLHTRIELICLTLAVCVKMLNILVVPGHLFNLFLKIQSVIRLKDKTYIYSSYSVRKGLQLLRDVCTY